jgi:hypothetical protein
LGEQGARGQHSVLTDEQKAFFATPADPLVPDGSPVYDCTPDHIKSCKLLQLLTNCICGASMKLY